MFVYVARSMYLQRYLSEDVEVMSKAVVIFESYRAIRVTNDISYRCYTTIECIILLLNTLGVSKMHLIRHTDFLFNIFFQFIL
jgi:hypothetical protein